MQFAVCLDSLGLKLCFVWQGFIASITTVLQLGCCSLSRVHGCDWL